MAALTAARATQSRGKVTTRRYKVGVDVCYAGGMAMIDSAGYAVPAAAAASNLGCVGVFKETVDNSGGSAGDLWAEVEAGEFLFAADSVAQANVNMVVYADDDQTVDETQATNCPKAGILVEVVSASSAWVLMGPGVRLNA